MIVFTVSKIQPGGKGGEGGWVGVWCSRRAEGGDRRVQGGGVAGCSVRPCGLSSGFDGAGHHAVRRVWKLRRHGRYFAARRVGPRASFREVHLKDRRHRGTRVLAPEDFTISMPHITLNSTASVTFFR